MKAGHVNPILESVDTMCRTMLGISVTRGKIVPAPETGCPLQITALVGISGSFRGVVALSFPENTALAMAGRVLGMEMSVVDDTVRDAIAELTNIVAGAAKAKFGSTQEVPNELSLPTVVRGSNYRVDYPSESTWIEIPFQSALGPFSLRLTFQEQPSPATARPPRKELIP